MLLLTLLPAASATDIESTIAGLISKMTVASAAVQDGTWLLRMEQWKDGRQLPVQEIAVKYRRAPESLYFHWVGSVNEGREVLWQHAERGGNLYVSTSPLVPNLSLDPLGTLAMRDSRHPVWMVELTRISDLIAEGAAVLDRRDDLSATYEDLGVLDVFGTSSRCYTATLPYAAAPDLLYAPKIRLCLSVETWLPSRFTVWADEDGAFRQVEDYVFQSITVNVGLTSADFSEDNPAYRF